MVYGFWDLVILFFKKTKSSSQELNEEKLRKERPRVKNVLRKKAREEIDVARLFKSKNDPIDAHFTHEIPHVRPHT